MAENVNITYTWWLLLAVMIGQQHQGCVCASDDDKWMGVWQLIFEFEQGKAIGDNLAMTFS